MLSIFQCTYWPFIYLLLESVQIFCPFLIKLLDFILVSCRNSLCPVFCQTYADICFPNIFCPSSVCLLIFLGVSFDEEAFHLMKSNLSNFFLMVSVSLSYFIHTLTRTTLSLPLNHNDILYFLLNVSDVGPYGVSLVVILNLFICIM